MTHTKLNSLQVNTQQLAEEITRLCELGNRFVGTPGEQRAADHISQRFRELGVDDVSEQPLEALAYTPQEASAGVVDRREPSTCAGLQSTRSGDVQGAAVYIGNPLSAADIDRFQDRHGSLEGKIVVMRTHWPFLTADYICQQGATGLVAISGAPDGAIAHYTAQLYPPPPPPFEGRPADIPGVIVGSDVADELLAAISVGAEIRLHHAAEHWTAKTANVIATVQGETDEAVIVAAHYDCQLEGVGAHDNAAGVGALLQLAALAVRNRPRRTMVFIALAGEEGGCWGSAAYCRSGDAHLGNAIGMVNLDVLGWKVPATRTLLADPVMMEFAPPLASEAGWDVERQLPEASFQSSDISPFVEVGIPSCFFWRSAPRHPYYHAAGDSLDLVDFQTVAGTATASARVAFVLAQTSVELPRTPTSTP
jgi:hypothetical protein